MIAVVGAGPTGLQVVAGLLEGGCPPEEIVIVERRVIENTDIRNSLSQLSLADSLGACDKSGKGIYTKSLAGQDFQFDGTESIRFSPSYIWGASCLPPHRTYVDYFDFDGFETAIDQVKSDWSVHAEVDQLDAEYPISTEVIGKLPRKRLAIELVKGAGAGVGHSRLAMGSPTSTCTGLGLCFRGCPSQATWSPSTQLLSLIERAPKLSLLVGEVERLEHDEMSCTLLVDGKKLFLDRIVVATGWSVTPDLVSELPSYRENYRVPEESLQQSTVCMFPLVLPPREIDCFDSPHFAYHDVVLVTPPQMPDENLLLSQIYLASPELMSRIATTAPAVFRRIISALGPRIAGNSRITASLSRIAVAMTFFPGGGWIADRNQVASDLRRVSNQIKSQFGAYVPRFFIRNSRLLDRGSSHHVGNWTPARSQMLSWLHGTQGDTPRVLVADTTILPTVPPGPHTLSAAAIARLIGKKIASDGG